MVSPSPKDVPVPVEVSPPALRYAQRIEAGKAELRALDRRAARFANARVLFFLVAGTCVALGIVGKRGAWIWAAGGLSAVLNALMALAHQRVIDREQRARIRIDLNHRGIARLNGGWRAFTGDGQRFLDADHLYAPDLNLFGPSSLFQLLNETATGRGEALLAQWLSTRAETEIALQRQAAARELAPLIDLRQNLVLEARLAAEKRAEPQRFIDWVEGGPPLDSIRWSRPLAWLLPLGTLLTYALGVAGVLPRGLWWIGVPTLLTTRALTRKPLASSYEAITFGEAGFARFEEVFAVLAQASFQSAFLRGLSHPVAGVPKALRQFGRLFSFAELRQSPLLHAVIHFFTLWDIHWLFQLDKWRQRHCGEVRRWFDLLAEFEAIGCLATLAHDRPSFSYPTFTQPGPRFAAQQLAHPLLDRAVPNDLELSGPGQALLITGSNMSGKSTLLRAIGTNAVLALSGAPTCARYLKVSKVAVLTSIRIKDSLEQGISYFYAEVKRIKAILAAAEAARGNALFLLDEILLGTNSEERAIASRGILRLLLRTGACGAVSTHDVSLAKLEREPDLHIRNVHFRESILNGRMSFDYRLRDGVLESGNALRVLREAGISLPD